MNARQRNKQGFTLIEVILVLAIAALIFLMIFIALPALQASQRDTSRRNDASVVSAAITSFVSGERRAIADGDEADLREYVGDMDQYELSGIDIVSTGDPSATQVFVYPGAKCDGSDFTTTGATARQSAVRVMLDNGTNFYCVDAS